MDGETPADDGTSATAETTDDRSSGGWVRKALLGLGLLGAVAVAVRRKRGSSASGDERRDTASESGTRSGGVSVDVQSPGEGSGASDAGVDTAEADASETMDERSVEDVREEPAEPGEMNVGEDVVEDVVDEDDEEAADEP